MQKVVGVKRVGEKDLYYFLQKEELFVGEKVVVDFGEFQTVAKVEKVGLNFNESKSSNLSKIIRKATEADLKKAESLEKKAKSFIPEIKKKSLELGLMMKFVSAEYNLDASKIVITFSSEERVDFRQFLKELASMLKVRIELKQIGQRDEIKVFGGVGPCGEPCCCARFLNDFEHVTVKMAKIQGISLSPTKINGICGRLMCCLGYESDMYEEILSKMPKINSEAVCPNGKGIVVYNDILRERVSIKRQSEGDTFVVEDFPLEEIAFGDKMKFYNPKKFEKTLDVVKEQKTENQPQRPEFNKPQNQDFKQNQKNDSKQNKPQFEKKNEGFGGNKNSKIEASNVATPSGESAEVMTLGAGQKSNQNQGGNKKHKFRFLSSKRK